MVMVENWIALREFARMRGVTLGAVQKAISSGRVKSVRRSGTGRLVAIELHAATREWNGNTDLDQATRAGAPVLFRPDGIGAPTAPESRADSGENQGVLPGNDAYSQASARNQGGSGDDERYLAARAKKQEFEAQQAELDYLEALGLIVSVEELQRVNARRYALVRDKLLNIPDRLATILASERDAAKIHSTITGEIKRVLNELADAAESETAGGATERVAARL